MNEETEKTLRDVSAAIGFSFAELIGRYNRAMFDMGRESRSAADSIHRLLAFLPKRRWSKVVRRNKLRAKFVQQLQPTAPH